MNRLAHRRNLGRLPGFLIAGAQKAGTTALHVLLAAHEGIFFPPRPQELDYFARDDLYARGPDWYRTHFAAAGDARAVGQTSTQILYAPAAAERIARDLPGARLIFLLRDPVDRAWSHYWHNVKYGVESAGFAEALEREPERLARGGGARRWFSYVARGFYARQLEPFLERCGRERVLTLLSEELAADPAAALDRAGEFLGVGGCSRGIDPALRQRRVNAARLPRLPRLQRWTARVRFRSPAGRLLARLVDRLNLVRRSYPPLPAAERRELAAIFAEDSRRLAGMLALDLSAWSSAKDLSVDPAKASIPDAGGGALAPAQE